MLPDGTILDNMNTLRKDNTGLDLKQLFIGSEGSLGVITKVSVLCPPKPSSKKVAFFGVESFRNVLELLRLSKLMLAEVLSAFEMVDRNSLQLVLKHISNTRDPISQPHKFYVLVEVAGSNATHDEEV